MADIGKYIPLANLYKECGVLPFTFNTINKLIWFAQQKPELIEKSHRFLFMPSIFTWFLTGEMVNDATMAGTSMLTTLSTRRFSPTINKKIGFPSEKFGEIAEPGTITGMVHSKASSETGIPAGVPVVATRVGGNTEIVADGITGFLVPPRDPVSLKQAICRVLQDPVLAARMASAGRQRILRQFSVESTVRETETLYLNLLHQ